MKQHPLTPDEVKRSFRSKGVTFTEWAKSRGYPRHEVYRVLNGVSKAHYGRAHQIAIDLGLKSSQQSQPQNGESR